MTIVDNTEIILTPIVCNIAKLKKGVRRICDLTPSPYLLISIPFLPSFDTKSIIECPFTAIFLSLT